MMRADIAKVLRPGSIAIVGASPDVGKFGGKVIDYLERHGYAGRVLPINPKYETVGRWPCYPSLAAIPADIQVDAVLISVPRRQVADIVRACGARKAAVAIVFTSGYAEAGADGREMQQELLGLAREGGVRIIGPNAFGFINFQDRVFATPTATLRHGTVDPGPIGLVSHSGGMAMGSIFARARERGIGFSFIIAPGNESDLDICEFIEFLADDPGTKVIAACIEGIDDGPRFVAAIALARERGKPVIVLKIGRSELGRQLALSHTAHMAGANEVFNAVARQYGVICVDDYDELYLQAALMAGISAEQRRLVAQRGSVALISISGGIAAVTGDLFGMAGLSMSDLAPATIDALRPMLPDFQVPSNPLDVGAVALTNPGVIAQAIEVLERDPGVGLIIPALTISDNYDSVLTSIVERAHGTVPIAVLWAGLSYSGRGRAILHEAKVPYFDAPRDLVTAVSRLVVHSRAWIAHSSPPKTGRGAVATFTAGDLRARAGAWRRADLTEWESKRLLKDLGFSVPEGRLVTSEHEAIEAAGALTYPLALKLVSADLPHKSDVGAVLLRLGDAVAVRDGYRRLDALAQSLGSTVEVDGMLLEEMIDAAVEVVVGLMVDPQFGPVVMVGVGGVLVELIKDVAFLVPPFSDEDVRSALRETRGLDTLLRGYRGRPAADEDALVALLVRLGDAAAELGHMATEVEMNPVLVRAGRGGAVVADALVRLAQRSG